jgi:type I restriction enzyme, S subunit
VRWARKPLNELSEMIDYGVTASADFVAGKSKFLRITDIQNNAVDWSSVPFCNAPDKKLANAALRDGDIVFARTGATTGKSFLLISPPNGAVFASYLIRVRPSDQIIPGYLAHFFDTPDYWRQIKSKAQGAAQEGVNASKLATLEIPLPPLDEQKRIAAILDKADQLRQKRRQAIALLDSLTQSIFLEMFGDPVTNPKGWHVLPLAEFESFLTSGSRGWAEYYSDQGSPFIRIQNLKGGKLSTDDLVFVNAPENAEARRTKVAAGDVLISITADLGRVAVVPPELHEAANINQHIALFRPRDINPWFLASYLVSDGGKRQFAALNRQGVKAGLNFNDIRSLKVINPPLELQLKFERILKSTSIIGDAAIAGTHQVESLFASLQYLAFTAQL